MHLRLLFWTVYLVYIGIHFFKRRANIPQCHGIAAWTRSAGYRRLRKGAKRGARGELPLLIREDQVYFLEA